jgi:histidyl-tRNA synthetase
LLQVYLLVIPKYSYKRWRTLQVMVELARGVRDFTLAQMQVRTHVLDSIRTQFRVHGFNALETPILERLETLQAKMAGSDDTDVAKEIFRVTDQGGRELGLRYDLTVPLARYVAMHKDLRLPLRRSEIGKVYRDGPVKLGRYREFVQCDADIIGAAGALADTECLFLAAAVFDALNIPVTIHVNDRALLDAICAKAGITNAADAIIALDKLEKIGEEGVRAELAQKGASPEQIGVLFSLTQLTGTNDGKLAYLEQELGTQATARLREIDSYAGELVVVTPTLARGLAYYTGVVFEAFAVESAIKSSLCGGGRYDNLIGVLGGEAHPAVGISFGIEPICEVLSERSPDSAVSDTRALIVPIGNTTRECVTLVRALRSHGTPVILDVLGRNVSKNMDYANKSHIPFVVLVGEKELAAGTVTLKDLVSGEEKTLPLADVEALAMELALQ